MASIYKRFLIAVSIMFLTLFKVYCQDWHLPVNCKNRGYAECLELTEIGEFGLRRKARPKVPSHLHTGIDIKRPNKNYENEPVYPLLRGIVISVRHDGPFAQIIIEHDWKGGRIWTIYEHVSGIKINVGELVLPKKPIARFMSREELNRYGYQFDHLHFEIMKKKPVRLKTDPSHPQRFYGTYSLVCYTDNDLNKNYWNPLEFFQTF